MPDVESALKDVIVFIVQKVYILLLYHNIPEMMSVPCTVYFTTMLSQSTSCLCDCAVPGVCITCGCACIYNGPVVINTGNYHCHVILM